VIEESNQCLENTVEKSVGLDCSTSGSMGGVSPGTIHLPGTGVNTTFPFTV